MVDSMKDLLSSLETAAKAHDAAAVECAAQELVKFIREDMATNPEGFVEELSAAGGELDRERVEALCDQLIEHLRRRPNAYPENASKDILNILRKKRYFDLMTRVADLLIRTGQGAPTIRRLYAQALLDQGHVTAGLEVLRVLEQDCITEKDDLELAETRGLMGRAHKQVYLDGTVERRPGTILGHSLKKAVQVYFGTYEQQKGNIWHGINAVALLRRAKRDKVSMGKAFPDASVIAKEVLNTIKQKKRCDLWDYATAGEACLALEDYGQALEWILKYTRDEEGADAFEYASTLRQFEEVWKLDAESPEQAKILHLLRSVLLSKEGGRIELADPAKEIAVSAGLESDATFEAILGKDRYKNFKWYRTGLERAEGVAQVLDGNGAGMGTGFLVRGCEIFEGIDAEWVVVTNAHVISDDPVEQAGSPPSLPADEAKIRFEAKGDGVEHEVGKILFSSPRTELDCTIVSLAGPVELANPYPIANRLPLVGKDQRVYVIGHPRGGGLSFSLDDNLLLDHEKPKVHYRAPTEGGSSGSPVFNQQWKLVALHHAGGMKMKRLNGQAGTYAANEGLSFQSIREAVAAALG